ncbi:MAG: hypothetical protein GKS01_13840 [Alphaproteobacteria bacterium]|nr:hypothetical protein [Alphaproteobacteria bacterium]
MRVVKAKSKERRRDRRIQETPIKVELNGSGYETANWSLGGFLLYSFYGDFQIGETPIVGIKAEVGDQLFQHVTRAEIVRIDFNRKLLAANFVELDDDVLNTLEGLSTGRLRREHLRKQRKSA